MSAGLTWSEVLNSRDPDGDIGQVPDRPAKLGLDGLVHGGHSGFGRIQQVGLAWPQLGYWWMENGFKVFFLFILGQPVHEVLEAKHAVVHARGVRKARPGPHDDGGSTAFMAS